MTVSLVGGVFLVAGVIALARPTLLVWVLAAAAALPATAAITYHGNSVPPFFVLAILTLPFALLPLRALLRPPPALLAMAVFAVLALAVTAWAPRHFAGTPILLPRGGIDAEVSSPTPLAFTTSVLAQCCYLVLGIAVAAFVGRRVGAGSRAPEAAFVTGIGLCSAQWFWERAGHRWPREQFENYANVAINRWDPRYHGVFPEPSYLAVFGVAALAYYVVRLRTTRGWALVLPVVMIGLTLLNLWEARSATAVIGAVATAVLGYAAYAVSFVARRQRMSAPAAVMLLLPLVALLVAVVESDRILALLRAKTGSLSAEHRFAADRFSLRLVEHTMGIGVGLGANRPSSFATMLLSCVGVVGTLLFVVVLWLLLKQAVGRPELQPAAWSLVGLLVAKVIGEPSLSVPLLWLLFGVLLAAGNGVAGGSRRAARRSGSPPRGGKRKAGVPVTPSSAPAR